MKLSPLEFEKPVFELEAKLADLRSSSVANDINFEAEVNRMEQKLEQTRKEIYSNLTAWQRVQIARHPARPFSLDYMQLSFQEFTELHGDRLFGDDADAWWRCQPWAAQVCGDRASERAGHKGELEAQLWKCAPGGLSQGIASDEDR